MQDHATHHCVDGALVEAREVRRVGSKSLYIGCSVAVSASDAGGSGVVGPQSAGAVVPVSVSIVWMVATTATAFETSGGTAARQRPASGSSRCPVIVLRFHTESAEGASAQRRATSTFQSSDRQMGFDAGSSCCAGHSVESVYLATRQAPDAVCSRWPALVSRHSVDAAGTKGHRT